MLFLFKYNFLTCLWRLQLCHSYIVSERVYIFLDKHITLFLVVNSFDYDRCLGSYNPLMDD